MLPRLLRRGTDAPRPAGDLASLATGQRILNRYVTMRAAGLHGGRHRSAMARRPGRSVPDSATAAATTIAAAIPPARIHAMHSLRPTRSLRRDPPAAYVARERRSVSQFTRDSFPTRVGRLSAMAQLRLFGHLGSFHRPDVGVRVAGVEPGETHRRRYSGALATFSDTWVRFAVLVISTMSYNPPPCRRHCTFPRRCAPG